MEALSVLSIMREEESLATDRLHVRPERIRAAGSLGARRYAAIELASF
jgi:hypothetical protein